MSYSRDMRDPARGERRRSSKCLALVSMMAIGREKCWPEGLGQVFKSLSGPEWTALWRISGARAETTEAPRGKRRENFKQEIITRKDPG